MPLPEMPWSDDSIDESIFPRGIVLKETTSDIPAIEISLDPLPADYAALLDHEHELLTRELVFLKTAFDLAAPELKLLASPEIVDEWEQLAQDTDRLLGSVLAQARVSSCPVSSEGLINRLLNQRRGLLHGEVIPMFTEVSTELP